MAFAMNGKVRIGYEVEGDGEPLVMVHGFSANIGMWREMGYVDGLAPSHRLILVDPRGHGGSDKPHDPAQYRPELMAGDVVAVLDHLGIDRAHFMGASMGAAIGFEIARRVPGRFLSLILQGYGRYGPLAELQQRFQAMGLMMEQMAATQAVESALASVERMIGPMSPADRARFLANDHQALLAFMKCFNEWPAFEDDLPGVKLPSLVVAAEGDPYYQGARECARLMPSATFVTLTGAHSLNSYSAENVVPHIKEFLAKLAVN